MFLRVFRTYHVGEQQTFQRVFRTYHVGEQQMFQQVFRTYDVSEQQMFLRTSVTNLSRGRATNVPTSVQNCIALASSK